MSDDQNVLETTGRMETLVDGIFAIAMTLLVLNLSIPQLTHSMSNITIENQLISLIPKFFTYALSFILLATFWRINHQQFYRIKRIDNTLVWITVIWLLFVALVPFSTSLVGEYGSVQISEIFFDVNMFLIGVLSALSWYYATEKGFTDKKLTNEKIHKIRKLNLIFPVVALLAIGATFITPSWSGVTYISIVIFKKIMDV